MPSKMCRRTFDVAETILAIVFAMMGHLAYADDAVEHSLIPFLKQHCFSCHEGRSPEAGLDLQRLGMNFDDPEKLLVWTLAFDRIANGEMPPKESPRPPQKAIEQFLTQFGNVLSPADKRGRPSSLRRLNRVEYENTVRDLFGIHIDLKDMLPEDASANGFDTVGEALSISPEQMEVYLHAAELAVDEAFGPDTEPKRINVRMPLGQDPFAAREAGKLVLKTEDDSLVAFHELMSPTIFTSGKAKSPGTYRVRIRAKTYQSKRPLVMAVYGGDVVVGRGPKHLVGYYDIGLGNEWTVVSFEDRLETNGSYKMTPYRLRSPVTGPDRFKGPGLMIGDVSIEGPLEAWPPVSRQKLLETVDPLKAGFSEARQIITRLLPMAFRRPVNMEEIDPFVELTKAALKQGRPFRESLRIGLRAVLCSPEFLMREELSSSEDPNQLSADALACRLSYFLWSSMPDDELFTVAKSGTLRQPTVLREQVERMLQDPKSNRFVDNFTGQWLGLRNIDFTEPDARLFPEYDEMLRHAIVEETHRFFREILDRDESLLDFVDSNWAILNERLAIHYGIGGITGQQFRRVQLPRRSVRGGVMTQASVMKVTANGTNTSPVVRGAWVLANIIGQPSPPPPPNVPVIEPDIRAAKTIRESLARHRSDQACAKCHDRIDPPGFALESFDPIGGFRENYRTLGAGRPVNLEINRVRVQFKSGTDVNPSGQLSDGRRFSDVQGLKELLREDKLHVSRCLTEKLLIYALGRRLGFSDRGNVMSIVQNVQNHHFGFRSLIHEIVQSAAFLEK